MGDTFYFVEEGDGGDSSKRQKNVNGELEEVQLGTYKDGDYFGGEWYCI